MKLLLFSDAHLDHTTRGHSRFDDASRAMQKACDTAIAEKVDRVFFLGDLCDPDKNLSPPRCVEFAMRSALSLAREGISSNWIAGNHDVIEDGSGTTTLTPMRALERHNDRIFVHERPAILNLPDYVSLLVLPFTATSHTYDPEEWARKTLAFSGPLIVLGHLSVEGVIPGEETVEMPRGRDVIFPQKTLRSREQPTLMANGHYHRQQTFDGIIIPGSLVRLTHGEEENDPGFLIVEWDHAA